MLAQLSKRIPGSKFSGPSPAHTICLEAYYGKQPIDTKKLHVIIKKGLSADELNARTSGNPGMTCLDIVALCEDGDMSGWAADMLIAAGADQFSDRSSLDETAIGLCIQKKSLCALDRCLRRLNGVGWHKFSDMLVKPVICGTDSAIPEDIWVCVDGKKGKTSLSPEGSADRTVHVTFEDGTGYAVSSEKVTIVPQAPMEVLDIFYDAALDSIQAHGHLHNLAFAAGERVKILVEEPDFFPRGLVVGDLGTVRSLCLNGQVLVECDGDPPMVVRFAPVNLTRPEAMDTEMVLKRIVSMEESERSLDGKFKCEFRLLPIPPPD